MKRLLTLLLLALGLSLALAQPAPLPEEARFDEAVEFKTGNEGESLRAMLMALAKSIGLTAVVDDVPDVTIVYDIENAKPFRQVWDIVLTLNELDYILLDNDVVVIGTSNSVARLRQTGEEPMAATDPMDEVLQRFYRVNNDPNEVVTIIRRAVPGVDAEALGSVGSIVVLGTQEQQDQVQATLDQFDRLVEVVPLEQRIYFLSNAKAEELAEVLQSSGLLSDDQAGEAGVVVPEFSVTAEPRTNSLIVTATAGVQARLATLIPTLDTPQQQVNIQVRIQEITRRNASNLGINLTAGVGNFATSILSGGLNFIFDAQNAVSGLNIGAVLDTLETQGLSRRVDDSNITVLNNETAIIQAGGTIYISLPGADNNIERTIPYGVQVNVTPRISTDGRVILDVNAKVEDVISETENPNFLNIATRAVNSTVTLEPGQTAVLAGLLQNSFTRGTNRVPVLGSLPLIGSLFSETTTEEDNVELLLIVNAIVIE